MAMLEINDLHVNYGMIAALKGISFEVNEGEVISLIGANGAGKTTTLHTLTGLISAKSGSIKFNGVELTKTPAHKIVEMGIAHVPEGRRIFQNLTVLDNLKLGAFTRKDKENIPKDIQDIYERFPRLAERKNQIARAFFAFCSTSNTVVPLFLMSSIILNMVDTRIGDRPIDGSSITTILGLDMSALPIASICCSPPERVPAI